MNEVFIIIMMIAAILSVEWFIKNFNSSSIHSQPIAGSSRKTQFIFFAKERQAVAVIIHLIMEESPNSFPKRL